MRYRGVGVGGSVVGARKSWPTSSSWYPASTAGADGLMLAGRTPLRWHRRQILIMLPGSVISRGCLWGLRWNLNLNCSSGASGRPHGIGYWQGQTLCHSYIESISGAISRTGARARARSRAIARANSICKAISISVSIFVSVSISISNYMQERPWSMSVIIDPTRKCLIEV